MPALLSQISGKPRGQSLKQMTNPFIYIWQVALAAVLQFGMMAVLSGPAAEVMSRVLHNDR